MQQCIVCTCVSDSLSCLRGRKGPPISSPYQLAFHRSPLDINFPNIPNLGSKVIFSIADIDGSGSINSKELSKVIEKVINAKPSSSDLEMLMKKMDTNNDGSISWDEFLTAMTEWLCDEDRAAVAVAGSPIIGSKRKETSSTGSSGVDLRSKIHKRIQGFFKQFQRHNNFDEMREKLLKQIKEANTAAADDDEDVSTLTPQEKLDRLEMAREYMGQLSEIAQGINSNDVSVALTCTEGLADILSVCDAYVSPRARHEVGDFFTHIFQRIAETGVIPRVINFIGCEEHPKIQYEAARVITYYAPGPRIAHTPVDSVFHPSRMYHKSEVIRAGAGHRLLEIMTSENLSCREQGALAIAAIASHDETARDFMYDLGFLQVLCDQIDPDNMPPDSYTSKVAFAIAVFCGHTHTSLLPFEKVSDALAKLAVLFGRDDEETLCNTCLALRYVLPQVEIDDPVCFRLLELLSFPSPAVVEACLELVTDILRLDHQNSVTERLIEMGLLTRLGELLSLSNDSSVRMAACELVGIIAITRGMVQPVLETRLFVVLLQKLTSDDSLRYKVVRIVKALVNAPLDIVRPLVEQEDIVKTLTLALSLFKTYDSVLRDTYQFTGATYNFPFVQDLVSSLDAILNHGDSAGGLQGNAFCKYFGMEVLDRIKILLNSLSSECAAEFDSWRITAEYPQSLEDQLKQLLNRIQTAHQRSKTSSYAEQIAKEVTSMLKTFAENLKKNKSAVDQQKAKAAREASSSSSGLLGTPRSKASMHESKEMGDAQPSMIQLKCFLKLHKDDTDGDNRVLMVRSSVRFAEVVKLITAKYNRRVIIQHEDDEGDKITIDSQELLDHALSQAVDGKLRLFLLPAGGGGGSGGAGGAKNWLGGGGGDGATFGKSYSTEDLKKNRHQIMEELEKSTAFSKHHLNLLYKQYQKSAVKGMLDPVTFANGLKEIGVTDKAMVDQMFQAFDHDKDGYVDFRDFACGLSVLYQGSYEDRLLLAFKAYDLDGNDSIDQDEMFRLLKSTFRSKGFEMSDSEIKSMVEKCFEKADADGNGVLDFEEFKQAVLHNEIVVQSFWKEPLK